MKDWEVGFDALISDFENDIDYLVTCWEDIPKVDVDHVKVLHLICKLLEIKKELIRELNHEV